MSLVGSILVGEWERKLCYAFHLYSTSGWVSMIIGEAGNPFLDTFRLTSYTLTKLIDAYLDPPVVKTGCRRCTF